MKLIKKKLALKDLEEIATRKFGNFVKAVVDIDKEIMVIDGELHSDEEALLLSKGSRQESLWGINLYPELKGKDFIEFDSMINVRPTFGNSSREVSDPKIRKKIVRVIEKLIKK